jgi:hypothetical protein
MTIPAAEPLKLHDYTLAHLFSALPSFIFSGVFLVTWIAPGTFGANMISYLMLIMLMEFINVHAAGFMGNAIIGDAGRGKKAATILGLGVMYTLFVGAFSLVFKEWWPLGAFWALVLNRLLGVLLGKAPTGQEKAALQASWAFGALSYIMLVFATILLPVPEFGVTTDVITNQGLETGGLWSDQPYRMMAFGFTYFAVSGCSELFSTKWNLARFYRTS